MRAGTRLAPPALRRGTCASGLACLILLAGCGSGSRAPATPACPSCAATVAQTRADTYASVAMRIYRQEVYGTPNGAAFTRIAPLPGLLRGLATGDYALARRTLNGQPVRHAVRERVTRAGKVLVDVGLRFVIAGNPRSLRAPGGRYLGRIEISIQDVIGFIKLVQRLTGTAIVVRGSVAHHAKTSLPAALHLALPASGPLRIGRRRYTVSSFRASGFGPEQLSIWILAPT